MHYLDELLLLYPSTNLLTRKFILGQLLNHGPGSNAEEMVELLWQESTAPEVLLQRQSRYVLGQYLPRYTQQTYRVALSENTTDHLGGRTLADMLRQAKQQAPTAAQVTDLIRAGCHHLAEPLMMVTALLQSRSTAVRNAASLILGRLWTRPVLEVLIRLVALRLPDFAACCSLGEIEHDLPRAALLRIIKSRAGTNPDLWMSLRNVPGEGSIELISTMIPRAGPYGRAGIAHAMANFPPAQAGPILERLVTFRETWTTAYVLDSIACFGDASFFDLVNKAWAQDPSQLIRLQVVRAVGAMVGPDVAKFCLERVRDSTGRVRAAALESLRHQDVDRDELKGLARGLLGEEHLRTRVQAIMIVSESDREQAHAAAVAMSGSEISVERREAAKLLGWLQTPGALQTLEQLAANDSSYSVRSRAVRSMARFSPAVGLPALLRLIQTPDTRLVGEICQALTKFPGTSLGDCVDVLGQAEAGARTPGARALLLRAMGFLAAAAGVNVPPRLLDALSDDEVMVQAGALEGLKRMGCGVPDDQLSRLGTHPDHRIRSGAALAAFMGGQVSQTEVLLPMLKSGQEREVLAGMNVLLEIGLLLPVVLQSNRFARLASRLRNHRDSAAFKIHFAQEGQPIAVEVQAGSSALRPAAAPIATEVDDDPFSRTLVEMSPARAAPSGSRIVGMAGPGGVRMVSAGDEGASIIGARNALAATMEDLPPRRTSRNPSTAGPKSQTADASAEFDETLVDGAARVPRAGRATGVASKADPHGRRTARAPSTLPSESGLSGDGASGVIAVARNWLVARPWAQPLAAIPLVAIVILMFSSADGPVAPSTLPYTKGFADLARNEMSVVAVEGEATFSPDGKPPDALSRTARFTLPGVLECKGKGSLTVADAAGCSITLGSSSRVRLLDAGEVQGSKQWRYRLEDPAGVVRLDARKAFSMAVRMGKGQLSLERGLVVVTDASDGRAMELLEGLASYLSPRGESEKLTRTDKVIMAVPSPEPPEMLKAPRSRKKPTPPSKKSGKR